MKTLLTAATLAALVAPALAAQPHIKSLHITQTTTPRFPSHLSWRGILTGETSVIVAVDETGKVTDVMPLAYTKRAFADEAVSAIRSWTYEPLTVDGEAHPAVTELKFSFESTGVVVQRTSIEMVEAFLKQGDQRNRFDYSPALLSELDRIPAPIKMVTPSYPSAGSSSVREGTVIVNFFIDEQGRVRFPCLKESDSDSFALSALEAVRQWRFAPPTRNGEPIIVRASQEFRFVAKKTK